MTVRAQTVSTASSLVVGRRRDRLALRLGHSVGPSVGDVQQQGDHQERGDHETQFVPTALMCEDHAEIVRSEGTSREGRPFYSAEATKNHQERREHPRTS